MKGAGWNESDDADFGCVSRVQGPGPHGDGTPLDALKRLVWASFERARRHPAGCAGLLGEPELGHAKDDSHGPSVFEMVWRHVRAAQRAGELKAADALLMSALIVGSLAGAADFAKFSGAGQESRLDDPECVALLLLDLMTTKTCN